MDAEIGVLSLRELGGRLIASRAAIDGAEARWLGVLAEFDRRCGWAVDGHRNCVSWLVHKCGLARSTAHDRLRVAHELGRRPVLADALGAGEVSYSKIRVLTKIVDVDDDADRSFLDAAKTHTAAELERIYHHYRLNRDQNTPPAPHPEWDKHGVRIVRRTPTLVTMEVVVAPEEAERLMGVVDTTLRATDRAERVSAEDLSTGRPSWGRRRVLALLDLLEAGFAHLAQDGEVDPERAMVHVMSDYDVLVEKAGGTAELDGGIPLSGEAARRLACDAGLVRIITRGASEILDVGRKTRDWTTPQRRAIRFRWGGRCAFPGCEFRITEIHHCDPWGCEGLTNLDCGVPVCHHHHVLVHEGNWTVSYDPTQRAAIFTAPDKRTTIAPVPGTLKLAA